MSVNTYDPAKVVVTFNGIVMQGFADGSFVTIERTDEGTKLVIGADGEATYVTTADKSGKMTVVLKQDSDSNRVLGGYMNAGTAAKAQVVDGLGFTAYSSDARIAQHPAREYQGKDLSNRTWIILCPKLVMDFPSGTTPAS